LKIEEVVRRAQEDEKYARRLRELAYKARDEGMESRAYKTLVKELAETPSDLRSLNTTLGYTTMLNVTASKFPTLCTATRITTWTIGGGSEEAPGGPDPRRARGPKKPPGDGLKRA
jgi:hypothetical protein